MFKGWQRGIKEMLQTATVGGDVCQDLILSAAKYYTTLRSLIAKMGLSLCRPKPFAKGANQLFILGRCAHGNAKVSVP